MLRELTGHLGPKEVGVHTEPGQLVVVPGGSSASPNSLPDMAC